MYSSSSICELWKTQLEFNKKLFKSKYGLDFCNLTNEQKNVYSKEFFNHLMVEVVEAMQEIPFKMHKVQQKVVDEAKLLEEFIDVFKFLLGWVQLRGFTCEQFTETFFSKSEKVEKIFNNEGGENNE